MQRILAFALISLAWAAISWADDVEKVDDRTIRIVRTSTSSEVCLLSDAEETLKRAKQSLQAVHDFHDQEEKKWQTEIDRLEDVIDKAEDLGVS